LPSIKSNYVFDHSLKNIFNLFREQNISTCAWWRSTKSSLNCMHVWNWLSIDEKSSTYSKILAS
jgi:hypothetical protein